MESLQHIIDGCLDSSRPLASTLRYCLMLSDEIDNIALRSWAENELNGYSTTDALPEYRRIYVTAKGTFCGPFGSGIKNAPLSSTILEKKHQDWATRHDFLQPIANYEHLIQRQEESHHFEIQWPPDLTLYYQHKFFRGYSLLSAWQVIPSAAVVGLIDSVRNKLLSLALQLRRIGPATSQNLLSKQDSETTQFVVNNIYGGNNVLAQNSVGLNVKTKFGVEQGNFKSLSEALKSLGIHDDELNHLQKAFNEDAQEKKGRIGPKVAEWLSKTAKRVAGAGMSAGVDVGKTAITKYLLGYLGLDKL